MIKNMQLFLVVVLISFFGTFGVVSAQLDLTTDDIKSLYIGSEFYDPAVECTTYEYTGNNNTQIAFTYFLNNGFNNQQTAGLIGNFLIESAGTMDPRIKQGGGILVDPEDATGKAGRGIAQWEFSGAGGSGRWDRLLEFAAANDYDPLKLLTQLDFVMFEMTGEPFTEGVGGGYEKRAYDELLASNSVEEAAYVVSKYYERNEDAIKEGKGIITYEAAYSKRIDAAEQVYDAYAGLSNPGASYEVNCERSGEDLTFDIIVGDTTDIPCEGSVLREYEADGYKEGKRYRILICVIELPDGSSGPHVNSQISGHIYAMFQDAWSDGTEMTGGGFRTWDQQVAARKRNGCPNIYEGRASTCRIPTAIPGWSNHQMGFAIDFHGVPQCTSTIAVDGRSFCQAVGNNTWEWLTDYANGYGMYQLRSEAWHWSIDGK